MIKVSVIVPLYNVSKYIDRCMESLVNQTLKDIEFIIVNDGSTDGTEEIINKYLDDKRIKYFKRTNHGIGSTRNFGLKKASGEYIGFVDSDDYIELDMYEKLYNKAENDNLDIVVCDFYRDNEENNTSRVEYIKKFGINKTNLREQPFLINDINLSPWNKLYKKDLIDDEKNFVENLKYEDVPFVIRMLDRAKSIGKIELPLYHYMIHKNSETTIMDKRVFDLFEIYNIIFDEHKDKDYLKDSLEYLFVCGLCNYNLQQRNQKDKKIRYEFINKSFDYINSHVSLKNQKEYYRKVKFLRRMIEQNKSLTKFYCNIYALLHNRK